MTNSKRVVRNRDLDAFWGVLRAKEPGFMRSLITWMGGPDGYINTNPGQAIESSQAVVGLMDMGPGNRQPGVHTHSVAEIYVIIEGQVESFDGVGQTHTAGPLDCLYIPKGVPHGVRTVGDVPVKLLWVNDEIEKWGVSIYAEGPGPHPSDDEVSLIRFRALEPDWSAPRAKEPGFMRWNVSWVGSDRTGGSFNPGVAVPNPNVGISLCALQPANRMADAPARGDQLCVVISGEGVFGHAGRTEIIARQDAVFCPAGGTLDLRALGDRPLTMIRVESRAA